MSGWIKLGEALEKIDTLIIHLRVKYSVALPDCIAGTKADEFGAFLNKLVDLHNARVSFLQNKD